MTAEASHEQHTRAGRRAGGRERGKPAGRAACWTAAAPGEIYVELYLAAPECRPVENPEAEYAVYHADGAEELSRAPRRGV